MDRDFSGETEVSEEVLHSKPVEAGFGIDSGDIQLRNSPTRSGRGGSSWNVTNDVMAPTRAPSCCRRCRQRWASSIGSPSILVARWRFRMTYGSTGTRRPASRSSRTLSLICRLIRPASPGEKAGSRLSPTRLSDLDSGAASRRD